MIKGKPLEMHSGVDGLTRMLQAKALSQEARGGKNLKERHKGFMFTIGFWDNMARRAAEAHKHKEVLSLLQLKQLFKTLCPHQVSRNILCYAV